MPAPGCTITFLSQCLEFPRKFLQPPPVRNDVAVILEDCNATQMAAISWSLTNHEVLSVVHELAAVVVVDGPDAIVAVDPWPAAANLRQRVAGASMPYRSQKFCLMRSQLLIMEPDDPSLSAGFQPSSTPFIVRYGWLWHQARPCQTAGVMQRKGWGSLVLTGPSCCTAHYAQRILCQNRFGCEQRQSVGSLIAGLSDHVEHQLR